MKADENRVIANIKTRRSVREELKIHQDFKIVAPLIFGYPVIMPPTPEKREPVVFWLQ